MLSSILFQYNTLVKKFKIKINKYYYRHQKITENNTEDGRF
jgi:hypothetical protein